MLHSFDAAHARDTSATCPRHVLRRCPCCTRSTRAAPPSSARRPPAAEGRSAGGAPLLSSSCPPRTRSCTTCTSTAAAPSAAHPPEAARPCLSAMASQREELLIRHLPEAARRLPALRCHRLHRRPVLPLRRRVLDTSATRPFACPIRRPVLPLRRGRRGCAARGELRARRVRFCCCADDDHAARDRAAARGAVPPRRGAVAPTSSLIAAVGGSTAGGARSTWTCTARRTAI